MRAMHIFPSHDLHSCEHENASSIKNSHLTGIEAKTLKRQRDCQAE